LEYKTPATYRKHGQFLLGRKNTPEDARVMAWWDYGYQITGIANRTLGRGVGIGWMEWMGKQLCWV